MEPKKSSKNSLISSMVMLCFILISANILFFKIKKDLSTKQDLIGVHPQQLSVSISKAIYEEFSKKFLLDQIDRVTYFNDMFEISTQAINLFYVPK